MRFFFLFILLVPSIGYSQKSIEFTVSAGYTAIDIENLVVKDEIPGTVATDWGQFSGGVSGQYFFTTFGKLGFGVELMYHYLYWYNVRVPFGIQDIFREYEVSVVRVTPILRFGRNDKIALDVGPEFNFSDGLTLGLMMSANYYIPISDKLDIPIKVRADVMNIIVVSVPITLNVGIRLKM